MSCYVMPVKCQAYKNAFTIDSLFLLKGTSAEGPATSSSSSAPSEIMPLDVHLLNLHRCFYHPRRLEVQ